MYFSKRIANCSGKVGIQSRLAYPSLYLGQHSLENEIMKLKEIKYEKEGFVFLLCHFSCLLVGTVGSGSQGMQAI